MANIDYNSGMLDVANRNADANMLGSQASMRGAEAQWANAGTNETNSSLSLNTQRYAQDLQAGKDEAARDALWKMSSSAATDMVGAGGWTTYTGTGETYQGFQTQPGGSNGGGWAS